MKVEMFQAHKEPAPRYAPPLEDVQGLSAPSTLDLNGILPLDHKPVRFSMDSQPGSHPVRSVSLAELVSISKEEAQEFPRVCSDITSMTGAQHVSRSLANALIHQVWRPEVFPEDSVSQCGQQNQKGDQQKSEVQSSSGYQPKPSRFNPCYGTKNWSGARRREDAPANSPVIIEDLGRCGAN